MIGKINELKNDTGAFSIIAGSDDHGKRLDFFVSEKISACTRSQASELIKNQLITVNASIKKNSYKMKPGDNVTGFIPPPEPVTFEPEDLPLSIIYEDSDLIVLNKMPGVVVHPAPGNWTGTLVNGLLYRYPSMVTCGEDFRPGIVHRLDKDTSGVMVVAKNGKTLQKLSEAFRTRDVRKEYLAVVSGVVKKDFMIVNYPIGRHPVDRKKMSIESPRGKHAETHITVERRFHDATLVRCDIKTGRTHQIRVHTKAIGHPIINDPVYNDNHHMKAKYKDFAMRQMLHSLTIEFLHPATSHAMKFTAPIPDDMVHLLHRLESGL